MTAESAKPAQQRPGEQKKLASRRIRLDSELHEALRREAEKQGVTASFLAAGICEGEAIRIEAEAAKREGGEGDATRPAAPYKEHPLTPAFLPKAGRPFPGKPKVHQIKLTAPAETFSVIRAQAKADLKAAGAEEPENFEETMKRPSTEAAKAENYPECRNYKRRLQKRERELYTSFMVEYCVRKEQLEI